MRATSLNSRSKSDGVVLALALIVILIMTVAGIAILSSSSLQERMAGNQKRIAESSMASDAGIMAHFEWLAEKPSEHWGQGTWPKDASDPEGYGFAGDGEQSQFFVRRWFSFTDPGENCRATDSRCVADVIGQVLGGTQVLAETNLQAFFQYNVSVTPLGGEAYILCGGDARVSGNINFTNTYLHCDGLESDVTVTGGASVMVNSRITSNDSASVRVNDRNCDDCAVVSNAGIENPPPNFFERVQEMFDDALESDPSIVYFREYDGDEVVERTPVPLSKFEPDGEETSFEREPTDCDNANDITLSATDFQSGDVVLVNGNVIISGGGVQEFSNVTIISTCDMTHNGALKQEGGATTEVNNVFYAGGNMTFNGASGSDTTMFEGRFFGGGDMIQNGKSVVTGQIIVNGDINWNGNFSFVGSSSLAGTADSQVSIELTLRDWTQVWR